MRRVVLIDGENLIYGLRTILSSETELASRDRFIDYPFRSLLDEVLGDEEKAQVIYFGARLRRYDHDPILREKSEKAIALQSRLINSLQRQQISFIKVGYLRARETSPCSECGNQEWVLIEKGVDVGLAARMITESDLKTEIVLVSSDTDLLPAVRTAKSKGAKIVYIGYEFRPILSLVGLADRTRIITKPMAEKYLESEETDGRKA